MVLSKSKDVIKLGDAVRNPEFLTLFSESEEVKTLLKIPIFFCRE